MPHVRGQMSDPSEWDRWLDAIISRGVNLTTWEEEFVESVERQRELGRMLSEKQAEILERIYSERTP
jgi:hypothetical protein